MNKKTLTFSTLGLLFACQLNSCRFFNESMIENNVLWRDEEGIFSFTIEGQNKYAGYGSMLIEGNIIDGGIVFDPKSNQIFFEEVFIDKYGNRYDSAIATFKYSDNNSNSNTLSGRINTSKDSLSSLNGKALTLKKTKIREDELDAKYFRNTIWKDDTKKLRINNEFAKGITATFNSMTTEFSFLDGRRFTMTIPSVQKVKGTYLSYKDGTMELIVEEGMSGLGLGNRIKMNAYVYDEDNWR